nr:hypothetical protein [uncultured Roseateles sp.]
MNAFDDLQSPVGRSPHGGRSPRARGFQLWIALPPELEQATVESQYVEAPQVPTSGPAHVVLGSYGGARSPARSPDGVTYLLVRLAAGAAWTFLPPQGQTVAWLAIASGRLVGEMSAEAGEMVLFDPSAQSIALQADADEDVVFVIGSALPHAHELHLGSHSVHTSAEALERGEANIERLRKLLVAAGDRRNGASGSIPVFSE